jgi:hypothetical protein
MGVSPAAWSGMPRNPADLQSFQAKTKDFNCVENFAGKKSSNSNAIADFS